MRQGDLDTYLGTEIDFSSPVGEPALLSPDSVQWRVYKNPIALRSLVGKGVQLRAFSPDILKAAQKAAFELYEDEAAKNPAFKKMYEPWLKFREDINLWHRVAEQTYSTFAAANPPPKKK